MRKVLWAILIFCIYIWVVTGGHEDFLLEKGKALYSALVGWLDDADFDFHTKKREKPKKRSRRWD